MRLCTNGQYKKQVVDINEKNSPNILHNYSAYKGQNKNHERYWSTTIAEE